MSQEFDCHYGEADGPTSIYLAGNEYGSSMGSYPLFAKLFI